LPTLTAKSEESEKYPDRLRSQSEDDIVHEFVVKIAKTGVVLPDQSGVS
jgi:hypothetical protein